MKAVTRELASRRELCSAQSSTGWSGTMPQIFKPSVAGPGRVMDWGSSAAPAPARTASRTMSREDRTRRGVGVTVRVVLPCWKVQGVLPEALARTTAGISGGVAARQPQAGRCGQQHAVAGEATPHEQRVDGRIDPDSDVETVFDQIDAPVLRADVERDAGVPAGELGGQRGEQRMGEQDGRADPHGAARLPAAAVNGFDGVGQIAEQSMRARMQGGAFFGEPERARAAFDEAHPLPVFQFPDLARQRGLGASAGTPGEWAPVYYAQRASMGLLITEGTQPSADGQGYANTPGLHEAAHVAGWRRVTEAVHAAGGRVFIQLMHAGRMSHPDNTLHHRQALAPSAAHAPG